MKQIEKGKEPKFLTRHRASGGTYKGWDNSKLRQQLLEEQGYICCYCMKRIPQKLKQEEVEKHFPCCKIEHVFSQAEDKHPELQLKYQNMLLACNGNHGQPKQVQTCDTFKGDEDFHFNPALTRNIEELIKYNGLGEIYSDDEQLNAELIDVLNLNTHDLKRIRADRYKFFNDMIAKEGKSRQGKDIQRRFYEAEKQKLITKSIPKYDGNGKIIENGMFPQFCMVGVYLLNKRLSKLN